MDSQHVITISGPIMQYPEILKLADVLSRQGSIVLVPFISFDTSPGALEKLRRLHTDRISISSELVVLIINNNITHSMWEDISYAKTIGATVTYYWIFDGGNMLPEHKRRSDNDTNTLQSR